MSERGLCVQGPLDDDGFGQVGLLQAQFFVVELPERQRRRQDERRAAPLGARHKILHVRNPGKEEDKFAKWLNAIVCAIRRRSEDQLGDILQMFIAEL